MKLRQVITENFVLLLVPALLVLFLILYAFIQSNLYENAVESVQKLSREAELYTTNYLESEETDSLADTAVPIASYLADRFDARVQLFGPNAELLADSERDQLPLLTGDIDQALKGKSSYLFLKETDVPVLFFSSPLYGETDIIGSVRFLVDLRTEAELLRQFTYVFTGVFLVLIVIVVWTARRMAKTLIGPIDDLRSVSHALTKGHYANALPAYPYEELNRLAADFSTLADAIQHNIGQLEQQRTDQQTFIDHITHELLTPMTAIMGYVELIPKLPPDEAAHCYHYIEVESQRLLRLVSHNLEQAKQQRNERHVTSTMFALDALLEDTLFIMQLRLDGQGIQVKQDVPPIYVLGQPDQTKQVLLNLLENAVKYSDAMSVTFSTVSTDTTLRLIMTDDGIGMDPAVLTEWEDEQHSLTTASGNGLGLPLCRRLMQEQGGDFALESDVSGTRITLTFRLANQT